MEIRLTRGDTKYVKFKLKDKNGENLVLGEGEKLYWTMKKNSTSTDKLAQKVYPTDITYEDGWYQFTILPADTEKLDYGTYEYDIEYKKSTFVQTLDLGYVIITKEITFKEDEV